MFKGRIAHGILTASFISAVIGTELPGPGSIYLGQTLKFRAPVRPGDDVRVVVEVTDYDASRRGTVLDTRAFVGETLVLEGEARVHRPRDVSQLVHDPALLDATDLVAALDRRELSAVEALDAVLARADRLAGPAEPVLPPARRPRRASRPRPRTGRARTARAAGCWACR